MFLKRNKVKLKYHRGLIISVIFLVTFLFFGMRVLSVYGAKLGESGSVTDPSLSRGLVGYWVMDEDGYNYALNQIGDFSSYDNHGTNYGSTFTEDRFASSGKAMEFTPNDGPMILDYTTWKEGQTGSVSGFNQNGSTSENYRVVGLDPWGREVVLWEAQPDSVSGGGWGLEYSYFFYRQQQALSFFGLGQKK